MANFEDTSLVSSTTQAQLITQADQVTLGVARRAPIVLTRGQGARVWDANGRNYLDFIGGVAVISVGHAHPRLVKALSEQAAQLMHVSNLFYNERAIELAVKLTAATGFARAFFCNSGTEAIEALIKLARRYHYERGDTKRNVLISMHGAFHGRSMGALTLTGTPEYHKGFAPLMGGVRYATFNDIESVKREMSDEVAAVFVEPIQGEGGVTVADDAYLRELRALCDASGALLIFDEIQTGIGRTGKFLAREWSGVWPDACALAKGLGGGFPLGAVVVNDRLSAALPPGSHGTTYGGNPLACSAGLTVLSIIEQEKLVENAAKMGALLAEKLKNMVGHQKTPCVVGHRGRGLLQGIALDARVKNADLIAKLRDAGLLAGSAGGNVLRLAPPLIINERDIDEATGIIEAALVELCKSC